MLKASKNFLAIAVAALIAGCGGGSGVWDSATPAPQTATTALRLPAGALGAVSAESAANQLMDFAEAHFPQYFPEHQTTQTNEPPFLYRHYSTGYYLGVVVTQNPTYILGGIYTLNLGGPGVMTYQGQLDWYITPVDNTPTSGANNGCYDLALADTQGTHSVIVYNYTGPVTGTQTADSTVGGLTTFEGHSARETTTLTTGTNTAQAIPVAIDTNNKFYNLRSGDSMINYGGVSVVAGSTSGINFTATARTVFSPPYTDNQYTLAIGQSTTIPQSGAITTTTRFTGLGIPDQVTTTPFSTSTVSKYVGRESVTVPAGTYNTCKFEINTTLNGATTVTTSYVIVGKGLAVKILANTPQGSQIIEATSVKLNGANL